MRGSMDRVSITVLTTALAAREQKQAASLI